MAEPDTTGPIVCNVLIPAVALIEAPTAAEAERILERALNAAGILPYEDDRDVFESEPVDQASLFTPHRCPRTPHD